MYIYIYVYIYVYIYIYIYLKDAVFFLINSIIDCFILFVPIEIDVHNPICKENLDIYWLNEFNAWFHNREFQ